MDYTTSGKNHSLQSHAAVVYLLDATSHREAGRLPPKSATVIKHVSHGAKNIGSIYTANWSRSGIQEQTETVAWGGTASGVGGSYDDTKNGSQDTTFSICFAPAFQPCGAAFHVHTWSISYILGGNT